MAASRDWPRLDAQAIVGIGVLALMAVVSGLARDDRVRGASNSFTMVVLLACLVLYGPLAAGVVGAFVALVDRAYRLSVVPLFNAAMMGAMCAAGGLAFQLVGGHHDIADFVGSATLLRQVGLPLLLADLAMCAVNVVLLAGMFAVTGRDTRGLLAGSVRELVPLFIGYALVAFVFVLLWEPAGVGPFSAVLIAAPLAIAHFVYVQYGDEVRAHERIVGMFTRAGDGPGGRVAAHGARVDALCQLIAGQLGLADQDRQTLTYAAHLHDIAMKSVVRATDIQRGGTGPYTNVRALIPHPELAEEIVSGVPFLADAAPAIRSHHERIDGRGYPDGLLGPDIPLPARILAVADAFDALTTSRGERAALDTAGALAELRLSAGSHLDAEVLDALGIALRSRERPAQDDPLNEGSWLWDHHTLPAMSDVIADELASPGAPPAAGAAPPPDRSATDASPPSPRRAAQDDAPDQHPSRPGTPRGSRSRAARSQPRGPR